MIELVLCSHGTRSQVGAARVSGLVEAVAAALPSVDVREAHVDVHPPFLDDVVTPGAIVVPLLLAPGYHVDVDIAEAVDRAGAHVTPELGPDALLTSVLCSRLEQLDSPPGGDDIVVLAAAGSSVPGSAQATRLAARDLALRLGRQVQIGYGSACLPRLDDLLSRLRVTHPESRLVAASYLLAPGFFHDRVVASAADGVTEPLLDAEGPDPRLVDLVVGRYHAGRVAAAS